MARPKDLPDRLKAWAYFKGSVKSAPLDLASRLNLVVEALRKTGWLVVVRSIGTDFAGPLGMPVPKDQPLELLIHRVDRPYTMQEAEIAFRSALGSAAMNYDPTERWMGEVATEIVEKTASDFVKGAEGIAVTFGWAALKPFVPWLAIGAAAYLYLGKRR